MGRKFTIFPLLCFVFEGKFRVQAPRGGLYSEGRFNGGFFCSTILGGLYLEGLVCGGAYFRNFTVFLFMDMYVNEIETRVVTKISSCRVNTTSRRGIKRLGISFGSIFVLFSNKSSQGGTLLVAGENPRPPALNDNPVKQRK